MTPKLSILIIGLLLFAGTCPAQSKPTQVKPAQSKAETAIRQVMANQTEAWNKGNIDEFMKTYWNNDSLVFIGKSGPTYGYRQALANYKKNYSSIDLMGKLFFSLARIKRLSPDYYFVIGKWFLKRKTGDVGGTFTLLFQQINGQWKIIVDHTS